MGGEQSNEPSRETLREETAGEGEGEGAAARPSQSKPADGASVPQTHMANKTVDDMAFMVACTNWY